MAAPALLSFLLLLGCTRSSASPNEGTATLHNRLHYYETLRKDQLAWQHLTQVLPHRTVVRFTTHGNSDAKNSGWSTRPEGDGRGWMLHLNLAPHPTIWSKDFRTVTEDDQGRQVKLPLNHNHFYNGTVLGAEGSSVVAHLPDDGLLTAVVRLTSSQVYHVERSHLHIHEPHDFHMITYLESDIKQDRNGFLLDSVVTGLEVARDDDHASAVEERRLRRQAPLPLDSCEMAFVADHRFTAGFAGGSASLAANLLILHFMDINDIYRKTTFIGDSQTSFGLQIKRLIVHVNASQGEGHYNRAEPFSSDQLLTAFAVSDWSDVCLAHLFTYQQFTDGRLGLAYIASTSSAGGICSTTRRFDSGIGSDVSFNTGYSTYLNPSGRRLLQREGIHATAHEIGHGWGSDHDPVDDSTGGPYLMHPFALSGVEPSHSMFSEASRRQVGRVLEVRGSCFQATTRGFCGDGLVRDEEQCDLGFGLSAGVDQCCDPTTCRLLPNASCSDRNDVCCRGCKSAPNTTLCRRADSISCLADTMCDGANKTCPESQRLSNGSECLFGRCLSNGSALVTCVDTCVVMGRLTCSSCDLTASLTPEADACRVCCRDSLNSSCELLSSLRSNGSSCQYQDRGSDQTVFGACENGTCVFSGDSFRLAEEDPGLVAAFGRFLATNIVGTVAFLVFLVFVFPSLGLHFLYDRHYYSKYISKLKNNKAKARMYTRRRTYRQKPKQGSRGPSPGRDNLVFNSEEHLLPDTSTTADGQKMTRL